MAEESVLCDDGCDRSSCAIVGCESRDRLKVVHVRVRNDDGTKTEHDVAFCGKHA
jgi:hypothetical protein